MGNNLQEGLDFAHVCVAPGYAGFEPGAVSAAVALSPAVQLNAPFIHMEAESQTAIAVARRGGLGVIKSGLSIEAQADEADRVKRSEHGVISDPFSLSPNHYVYEAGQLMAKFQISGVPVTEHEKLVGIITNRDLRFETGQHKKIYEVMTHENLITAPEGTSMEEAKHILTRHKVEKLPLVDEKGHLRGLITIKDIDKSIKYPHSAKDAQGRLLVGAAISPGDDAVARAAALAKVKVDLLALDAPHGHTRLMLDSLRAVKEAFPHLLVMAGNVATAEAAAALLQAGADIIKVGVAVAGVGVPPVTALLRCAEAAHPLGIPVIADGGLRRHSDAIKALTAGALACAAHLPDAPPQQKNEAADEVGRFLDCLLTGMYYAGCQTVAELHDKAGLVVSLAPKTPA